MGAHKKPAMAKRQKSNDDFEGLAKALKPWANDRDFVKYTIDKSMKKKEKHHLELYVNHLKRIQDVDRTFNFSLATITSALHTVNKENGVVDEKEEDGWCANRALRLAALFRHTAQEALNCRKWMPKEMWTGDEARRRRPKADPAPEVKESAEVFGEVPDYESFVDTQIMLRPVIPTGGSQLTDPRVEPREPAASASDRGTNKRDLERHVVPPEQLASPRPKVPAEPSAKEEESQEVHQYEFGWCEESLRMWRKQILGPKKRGPIEFSKVPTVDDSADGDAPVVCVFGDGQKAEVSHLTMEDLAIKLGKKSKLASTVVPPAGEPSEQPAWELDPISKDPRMKRMMKEEVAEGERGSLKIQLKPQKGRSAIVSMLFKGLEDKKFSQKSQVVVKPPTILAVDAMVIVKFLSCKFMDGEIDLEAMKAAKYDLLEAHQQGKLLDRLKSELDPNNPSNQEFLGIVELRQTLTLDTSGGQHDGRADGKPTPGTGNAGTAAS
ncbi:unnamed protein product [Durusdinium trenchii]|uniref:Condensin complex subunit 2 n=2 Tax=Durusdinium trenchii TaxID=1381693 RepID=A0ABP0RSB7_9DINO